MRYRTLFTRGSLLIFIASSLESVVEDNFRAFITAMIAGLIYIYTPE